MNELLASMSKDMRIDRYVGESLDSFTYRLLYSSLGMWCLWIANSSVNGEIGVTKNYQTQIINELIQRYNELFPGIIEKFISSNNHNLKFAVHLRRVYEETGYLITNEKNRNYLAKFGRCLSIGDTALYFGIPSEIYAVNGLGVFSLPSEYSVSTRELLIRDDLSVTDYVHSKFNIVEFIEADNLITELQFFNPLSNRPISQSWDDKIVTEYTIARNVKHNFYYRVIRESNGTLLFANEISELKNDLLTSYEYRRLYYALKAYYANPSVVKIINKDDNFVVVRLEGHLPNREYYLLLLLSWPYYNAFDKTNFLIKKEMLPFVRSMLINIGIDIKEDDR
jgi:hypothetical protein